MFKKPFGFEGRISRKEYILSVLLNFIVGMSIVYYVFKMQGNYLLLVLLFPGAWFIYAQGVKRCHDFGESAWFLWNPFNIHSGTMLGRKGNEGENEFGPPPEE